MSSMPRQPLSCEMPQDREHPPPPPLRDTTSCPKVYVLDVQNEVISYATAHPNLPMECSKRHSTLLHRNEPTVKDGKPPPKEKLDQNNAQEKRHYSPSTLTTANTYSISLTSHVIPGWSINDHEGIFACMNVRLPGYRLRYKWIRLVLTCLCQLCTA